MKRDSSFHFSRQRGMSLIEILIGITIGLIIIIAAGASLLIVRSSSRTMTDSAALEQQATLAMLQIGRQLSQANAINTFLANTDPDAGIIDPTIGKPIAATHTAAYTDRPDIRFDIRPTGVSADQSGAGGIALSKLAVFGKDGDTSSTPPTSDTLSVSYAAPNDGTPANNCSGVEADKLNLPAEWMTSGGEAITSFTVPARRLVSTFSVKNNSLECSQDPNVDGNTSPAAANMIEMRVNYLAVDDKGTVTYYKNADAVTASSTSDNWKTINAVQVCLEIAGDRTQAAEQKFVEDCQGKTKTVTDGRLHRIVRNTFYLRNPLLL